MTTDESAPEDPVDEPAPDRPVYTAPLMDPPPNPGVTPNRGEQGGDGG